MTDGTMRALLDQALDDGPLLPRIEAADRLALELQALAGQLRATRERQLQRQ